jgi:hypothetical protein
VQDRDGPSLFSSSPAGLSICHQGFADAGYAAERPAMATLINVDIVSNPPDQGGIAVHPKRWVVERFSVSISRNRGLCKDPETTLALAQAFLYAAAVMTVLCRLAPS